MNDSNGTAPMTSTSATHALAPVAGIHARVPGLRLGALALIGVALVLTGCGKSSSSTQSNNTPGTLLVDPQTGANIVVEANQGGGANRLGLTGAFWGRLVDIYDFDAGNGSSTLQFRDFVIGDNIASDLVDFRLDRNAITETEILTILHPAGTPAFLSAFAQVEANVQPFVKRGLPTTTLPVTYTAMPRNATLVLTFDDLIDASTITAKNVAVFTGYPPVQPYEYRVVADPSHGDLLDRDGNGTPEFYSTRVLVDMTVSQLESQQSNPPLPVNSLGLPEAQVSDQPNVVLRVPTKVVPAIGQLDILSNLGGSGLAFGANSPNDPQSTTLDVVRAFRSSSADLGDPNNGFLVDQVAPRIVGVQGVTLFNILPAGGTRYFLDAQFEAAACAQQPRIGDVIRIGSTALALVDQIGSAPSGGFITNVRVDLQVGDASTFLPGQAQYLTTYDPTLGALPECFVRISPTPSLPPAQGVSPNASLSVRFSEPMDPASISGFERFFVTRITNAPPVLPPFTASLGSTVVGSVQPSLDLREFTYTPQLPFGRDAALNPQGEDYLVTLTGGANGVIDLAGRPLADALPPFTITLDPAAATAKSSGFVFKFNTADEDGNTAPEIRGQFLFNFQKGTIRPRPVARFSAVADQTQAVVGIMIPFTQPIQTPLANLGSKMMGLYRYHDVGLGLADDLTHNLDIEGMSWAPFLGLQVDSFDRFRLALAHSKFLPDEIVGAMTLLPNFPNSGVVKTFDSNLLDPANDPLNAVHPKDLGYDVQPVDSFISSTGTLMMPWPLNRTIPQSQWKRYTWRDNSIQTVGAPGGSGVETDINGFATGLTPVKLYAAGKVPTIGLPLLMEFRCYPDDAAFGLNGFKINIAINSSARPAFRAFSTGGVLSTGALFKIDPDNEPNARGGINPATGQPTGIGTEIDNSFYLGQLDFVVRVNRVHTIWFDTLQFTPQYQTPLVEPPASLQPLGTQVIVALRVAQNVTPGTPPTGQPVQRSDATKYDAYGDPRAQSVVPNNFAVTFPTLPGGGVDNVWRTNPALLNPNSPRFVQARITMISNPDTLLFPEVSGFGFSLKN